MSATDLHLAVQAIGKRPRNRPFRRPVLISRFTMPVGKIARSKRRYGLSRFRFVVSSLIAIGVAGAACGQTSKPEPHLPNTFPKNERAGVGSRPRMGFEVPLWPASMPLAKPDRAIVLRGPVMARGLWEGGNGIGRAMSPDRR